MTKERERDVLPIIDPSKVIFNHSDRKLTDIEKEVLSLGLDFALPVKKLNYVKHFYYAFN